MAASGLDVGLVCFTHGGASTLGLEPARPGGLQQLRAEELASAARVLGLSRVELLDYPDGGLEGVHLDELAGVVEKSATAMAAGAILVFDEGGITGHPDHRQATRAGLAAAARVGIPALAWAITETVASALNVEFGSTFVGRGDAEIQVWLKVDRRIQKEAISCHRSQAEGNRVLWRRLELSGSVEPLRLLGPQAADAPSPDQRPLANS